VTEAALPLRDLHSHLIPGVDDGADSTALAVKAVRSFLAEGVGTLVATPHLRGSLTQNPELLEARLAAFDRAWKRLGTAVEGAGLSVDLRRGSEVMMDDPHPDFSDPRVRLDGGRFVLVEWPGLQVPPGTGPVLQRMVERSWVPVVAHPERYWGLDRDLKVVERWRTVGARLQVNHGSLLGHYGATAQGVAFRLLRRGWVDFVSSDFHPRPGRGPEVEAAALLFEDLGAEEQWQVLASVNPGRILDGEDPLPVPALPEAPGFWERVRGLIRKGAG
jgi:protein-tyrosine phosphatase